MGSSRGRRTYKPRGRGGHRTGGTTMFNRRYKPRRENSAFNRFHQPRHQRDYGMHRQRNDGPIAQGDGTWYDPNTGEYFRKESLMEMLRRWFSFFSGGKR
jgi:hypothetical protein